MRDASFLVAAFAVLFLFVALFAWWRILRKPDAVPPTRKDDRRSESAARVIVIAFLLSAAAALIAVISWIQR